jgi:hypothetical protein
VSPLAGEFAPEPGPLRGDDARKQREFESFKANYDTRLGRELTPQEVTARDKRRAVTESWAAMHAADDARDARYEAERVAREKASDDRERQRKVAADVERRRSEARARIANEEMLLDSMFDTHGASKQEREATMNELARRGVALTSQNAWHELLSQRCQMK